MSTTERPLIQDVHLELSKHWKQNLKKNVHANEHPFRLLFQHLDGKSKFPKGFFRQIGRQVEKCEDMEIIDY